MAIYFKVIEGGVHNSYLILWLNTGLIGVIVYFRSFFLSFFKANKNTKLAFPIMFSVMFSINFEPWLMSSLNPFTIGFLLILTLMTEDIFQNAPSINESDEIQSS
jgi:O-antigen ligase